MAFKPGVSGNPAGRPKKLLRRVDEVLHAEGVEPIAEVVKELRRLAKVKDPKKVEAARRQRLQILLELLPYVHPKVKEQPADGDDLDNLETRDLLKIVCERFPELRLVKGEKGAA